MSKFIVAVSGWIAVVEIVNRVVTFDEHQQTVKMILYKLNPAFCTVSHYLYSIIL